MHFKFVQRSTKDSSPCNSTLMNQLSAREILHASGARGKGYARLQLWPQTEQEGRQSEQTEVRDARLDRQSVHGEESVVFSRSISVELDSEGSIVSTCTEHLDFEDVTSLIHSSVI